MSCEYPEVDIYDSEYEYTKFAYYNKSTQVELLKTTTPLGFLTMISPHEGYVLTHSASIDQRQSNISFTLLRLYSEDGMVWESEELFIFTIPTSLLVGHDRLYESILPFLPSIYKDSIYFVSSDNSHYMNLYSYNCKTFATTQVTHNEYEYLCSPCFINNSLYYGGALKDYDTLSMYIDSNGLKIRLPKSKLDF
jgi:hypothetical protein